MLPIQSRRRLLVRSSWARIDPPLAWYRWESPLAPRYHLGLGGRSPPSDLDVDVVVRIGMFVNIGAIEIAVTPLAPALASVELATVNLTKGVQRRVWP